MWLPTQVLGENPGPRNVVHVHVYSVNKLLDNLRVALLCLKICQRNAALPPSLVPLNKAFIRLSY